MNISKENKTAVSTALKELESKGYIQKTQTRSNGKIEYIYHIFEKPYTEKPYTEKPYTEKPYTENLHTENQPQINYERMREK